MDSQSLIADVVHFEERILQIIVEFQASGAKCHELGEKVRSLLDMCQPLTARTNEELDACQSDPILTQLQSLLSLIERFLNTVPSLISEGMDEELEVMIKGFEIKMASIVDEITRLGERAADVVSPSRNIALPLRHQASLLPPIPPSVEMLAEGSVPLHVHRARGNTDLPDVAAEKAYNPILVETPSYRESNGDEYEGGEEGSNDAVLNSPPAEDATMTAKRIAEESKDGVDNPVLPQLSDEIALLVQQLRHGTASAKEPAAETLKGLVKDREHRVMLTAAGDLALWIQLLREGSDAAKDVAAQAVGYLNVAKDVEEEMVAAGVIPLLVQLLRDGSDSAKEAAAIVLSNLVGAEGDPGGLMMNEGAIPLLVQLLKEGTEAAKEHAASALWNLVAVDEKKNSNATTEVIPLLVQLMQDSAESVAMDMLERLAELDKIKLSIVAAGAVPLLLQLLRNGSEGVQEAAIALLASISCKVQNLSIIVAAGTIPMLVQLLREGSETMKVYAAKTIQLLAVDGQIEFSIVAAGVVPPLVDFLKGDEKPLAAAAAAFCNFPYHEENKNAVAAAGAIPLLVQLLKEGPEGVKKHAAGALTNLLVDMDKYKITAAVWSIPLLVQLLSEGTDSTKQHAAGILHHVALCTEGRMAVVSAGAVPILVQLLQEGTDSTKEEALGALWSVSQGFAYRRLIVAAGAVPLLMQLLLKKDGRSIKLQVMQVVGVLALDTECQKALIAAGIIPLLVNQLKEGSQFTKEQAVLVLWHLVNVGKSGKVALRAENPTEALKWLEQYGSMDTKGTVAKLLKRLCE